MKLTDLYLDLSDVMLNQATVFMFAVTCIMDIFPENWLMNNLQLTHSVAWVAYCEMFSYIFIVKYEIEDLIQTMRIHSL